MKRNIKLVFGLVLTVMLLLGATATAFAGTVSYGDDNAQKFVFAPTNLFENLQNVMPGDTCTDKITIKNNRINNVKIKLYMRSLGADDASKSFLSQLDLTVKDEASSIMFQAAADQKAQLTEWTYIGTIYSGGKIDLNITLQVPKTLDNTFQDAQGNITWEFAVEELPVEEGDPTTGDESMIILFIVLAVASVATFTVVTLKKQKAKA